ncbi:MAG: 23S rRNA (adenine(2503)-C(2))-methyltransferase RlmN [Clostridia bacterium]
MKILQDYNIEELKQIITGLGEPSFRAKQIFVGLHQGKQLSEMTNLPKSLISKLEQEGYTSLASNIAHIVTSKIDGTKKYLFEFGDKNIIEGVFMQYSYGNTVCISTQIGCRMNCAFCASGAYGLVRNLTSGEILSQVINVNKDNLTGKDRAVTNIVLMGSGEPLDNFDNVIKFLELVSDENGLNISKRNISLSTCGLCDNIKKLADLELGVTLTISLYASNDAQRKNIMPIANKYSISDIMKAARYYFEKTKRRIIFEYSMINGENDRLQNARELALLVKGLPCHINLIRLNFVKEKNLKGSNMDNIKAFMEELEKHNISVTLRRSMGVDIDGACGQLRQSVLEEGVTLNNKLDK